MPEIDSVAERRKRIVEGLRERGIDQAVFNEPLWEALREEAASDPEHRLITPDLLRLAEAARQARSREPNLRLFSNTDDVIIVPGFLGCELVDQTGPNGLIWIDPTLVIDPDQLLALKLDANDHDATPGVRVEPQGAVPVIYSGLKLYLEFGPYAVDVFGFDWRKPVDVSAKKLAAIIGARNNARIRPLHLVAHSQGSLVARRALQLLGADLARKLVHSLVLLGPASGGTFSSATALAGSNSLLEMVRRFGIKLPDGFTAAVQTMTGLYQLLPWRTEPVDGQADHADNALNWVSRNQAQFQTAAFWKGSGIDARRLTTDYAWGKKIDTVFFNDRTTIILGDKPTAGGVKFVGSKLVDDPDYSTTGDGTVPDSFARLPGVTRVYKARGAEHMLLPATFAVISAVRDALADKIPRLEASTKFGAAKNGEIPFLAVDVSPADALPPSPPGDRSPGGPPPGSGALPRGGTKGGSPPAAPQTIDVPAIDIPAGQMKQQAEIPTPTNRRLRVYSFDPLLGNDLDMLGVDQITLELPWEFADGNQLTSGPVGEYVEVVDFDPASNCFYPPVDLNHSHLLAQDGFAPTEGDPRFHQQMAYAVAMNTIHEFETALGRPVLWAPHLRRDAAGTVISSARPEDEFVRRLRIYPHAMRQANAFYHPDRKALLFGYFQAQPTGVERNLPGGMVFTCLSFDIVAHETAHALLDGVHRYFTEPSNGDVFAFHEGFADIIAMFQHFSHPGVLRHLISQTRGDITGESQAGVMAAQFGDAIGHRGALREYLGRKKRDAQGELVRDASGRPIWEPVTPDPSAVKTVTEPHARGAILVAALFRAFTNIYDNRVVDLRRIATNGTGILPDGEISADLVVRMAEEAAKAARHMLTMCIRALDYIPPVDLTFGEYLRALITADYDLVQDDDRRYRAAVISAFRDWGIYPADVRSLAVDSLLWKRPESSDLRRMKSFFVEHDLCECCPCSDRLRAFSIMRRNQAQFHIWLQRKFAQLPDLPDQSLGLALRATNDPGTNAPRSIKRDKNGDPVFEVHSLRPCRRIGPDGQERADFVVEIVQRRKAFFDEQRQADLESGKIEFDAARPDFYFRGGCTLVIDPCTGEIRYCIRKSIGSDERLARERQFRQGEFGSAGAMYLSGSEDDRNPFASIHSGQ